MNRSIRLASIPTQQYPDFRYQAIFRAYKWDPQVEDHNTVSRHVALLSAGLAAQLGSWAEQLAAETVLMEEALAQNPALAKELCLPSPIFRALRRMGDYDAGRHVRLMRFDFHPTAEGWAVSEVNSDVPGGFAEASALPRLAAPYFGGYAPGPSAAGSLAAAFAPKLPRGGVVAFVHATSYADDRQVMQCLRDAFAAEGYRTILAAPDHLRWAGRRAASVLDGQEGPIDGVVRFFPLEWLANLPRKTGWEGYFSGVTPSCNHPIAMFAQSKRLPLVWDRLGVDIPAWRALLPQTEDPRKRAPCEGWLYKPALGRVGEGISVRGVVPPKEQNRIEKAARRQPKNWVAQRMFESLPLETAEGGRYHLCIGVFTIEGRCAGFYGRISPYPRIDANAMDIPILVKTEERAIDG